MLHVTNGDATATKMRESGIGGTVLPWRDVLHEGPVPAGMSLTDLSRRRARFIADAGWAGEAETRRSFGERDAALGRFRDHEAVLLWFEHDLYDQLQLIQILDWFADQERGQTPLGLICVDAVPGYLRFRGLGELRPSDLASLVEAQQPVGAAHFALAKDAWRAFRSPDPRAIESVLADGTAALPFLAGALVRHLEQFPAVGDGLSRTERQVLDLVAADVRAPVRLFEAAQDLEERPFMGDTVFWTHLARLTDGPMPLLDRAGLAQVEPTPDGGREEAQHLTMTATGAAVRAGIHDWQRSSDDVRWLGGVRLQDDPWRWDRQRQRLVGPKTTHA